MALRFRKSIKLAPSVRWNLSGSGSSWTFGPRGASVNVGSRGTFLNAGIGAGLSSTTRLSAPRPDARRSQLAATSAARASTKISLTCTVSDDGLLVFTDGAGQPASDAHVALAKAQAKDALKDLIASACDRLNGQIEALSCLHHETPDPAIKPTVHASHFADAEPVAPAVQPPRWWDRLVPGRCARIAEETAGALAQYEEDIEEWTGANGEYDRWLGTALVGRIGLASVSYAVLQARCASGNSRYASRPNCANGHQQHLEDIRLCRAVRAPLLLSINGASYAN